MRVPDRPFGGTRTGVSRAWLGAHILLGLRMSDVSEIGGSGMAVVVVDDGVESFNGALWCPA
jgi:hypothetical protein